MRRSVRMARGLGALALLLAAAACYEHTFVVGDGAPDGRVVYEKWHHHWIAGLISPDHVLEIQELCPSGDATIHEEISFLNGLVGALTSGIYQPTTVQVRCRRPRRARREIILTPQEVRRIVAAPAFLERVAALAPARLPEVQGAQEGLR